MVYRIDSHFDVAELALKVQEPELYLSTSQHPAAYKFDWDGIIFKINLFGKDIEIEATDPNLKKIRHECVSNALSFTTDMPLSLIGVQGEESELTPDVICVESKTVVEVTTCAVPNLPVMKNAYSGKIVKYNYLVEPLGYTLAVLVVSASSVYTNLKLTQDVINCLCYRARIGLAFESLISTNLGSDIFSEDLTGSEFLVKAAFREIQGIPESEENFDVDKILECRAAPTQEDHHHTAEVLAKALNEAKVRSLEDESDLRKYQTSFDVTNSRDDIKRITNIPMVATIPSKDPLKDLDPERSNMPSFMKKIWCDALQIKVEKDSYISAIKKAKGEVEFNKHFVQKGSAFNVTLSKSDQVEAAKTGLWAKGLKNHPEIEAKDSWDHRSFHPYDTPTNDITKFMDGTLLDKLPWNSMPSSIASLIEHTKKLWTATGDKPKKSLSFRIISRIASTPLGFLSKTISDTMTEVCYSYRYWVKRADFYHKEVNGIHILVRPSGSHVFCMFAYPKDRSKVLETGRLGPTLFESPDYIFSDVSSFNEPTIEHFVKAAPYLTAIVSHLISNFEIPLDAMNIMDPRVVKTLNGVLLLYLNNKTDVEELITSQRYFTMGLLEDLDPNPYRFCDRLPEVLRSRLTCHFVKRSTNLMHHYAKKRIIKVPIKNGSEVSTEVKGLVSIFGDFEVDLRQKINEFYFGYVISKERGRGSDRNFKIMKKIVTEEYRFRDTVKQTLLKTMDPGIHQSDHVVMKVFLSMYRAYLKDLYGPGYESVVKQEIIKNMAKTSFVDLATLKVAARSYQDHIIIPELTDEKSTADLFNELKKINPEEVDKRPRVMEALARLTEKYKKDKGKDPQHPVQLLPYCLKALEKQGFFDSDIFPKPQHGGDREIHVLDIVARMVQFYTESIAKTLCHLSPTDSLTHPTEKENFVKKHYLNSNIDLGDKFFTLGKSADATKWCQRNHSSKFACILAGLTDDLFLSLILRVMKLWQHKRITFPLQFAANFLSNQSTKSNKIYKRLQSDFLSGTGLFEQAKNNKMIIRSGMMQGILHYTSSICHAVVQIAMAMVIKVHMKNKKFQGTLTTIQGSDDSAALLSIKGPVTDTTIRFATTMLNWKERVSRWFSIYTSRAKSAIGTLDIVEYNSEWFVKTSVIKPTFRWVSACLETTVVEKFIDRVRMNYNTMSQVLEGGGKVLECAMIQICQAWLHYMMLGLHNHILSDDVAAMIFSLKDPSLGFYPLDSDFIAGFTGVDFQLYHLFKTTTYGRGLMPTSYQDPVIEDEESPETKDVTVSRDLRSAKVKFGSLRIWFSMIRKMKVPELVSIVEEVEKNPYLLYSQQTSWEMSKYQIYLKVFQPGVKESVSSYSPVSRLMAASAYMINRPCITILGSYLDKNYTQMKARKMNLFTALEHKMIFVQASKKPKSEDIFPFAKEYDEVLSYLQEVIRNHSFARQSFKTKTKQKILIFEKHTNDVPVSQLCKKVWLKLGKLPLSSRQVLTFWNQYKLKYPFLKDSMEDTKKYLGLSTIELKNFLESLDSKPRHVVLLDTSAKSSNLLSSITRTFWSNTKIMLPTTIDSEESSFSIRSKCFSIITSCLSDIQKKYQISKILKNSKMLDVRNPPSRVAKLKVFRDWQLDEDKDQIIFNISNQKLGSVGFFTARQRGYGKDRKGYGEWRGSCLGIPTVIKMHNNTCTEIIIQRVYDMVSLGHLLSDLSKGFQLEAPLVFTDSEYWLSPTGKIVGGSGKASYIPMKVDQSLQVDIIDKISEYHWDWEIAENRLRLVAMPSMDTKITVLSESFTAYDWDPSFVIEEDGYLQSWSTGSSMPISIIEEELLSAVKMTPSDTLKGMKDRSFRFTKSGWNLKSFIDLIKWMLIEDEIPDIQEDPTLSSPKQEVISDTDLELLMMELNTMTTEGFEFGDWSEEMEMTDEDLALFDSSMFTDELLAQMELFANAQGTDDPITFEKKKMPKINLCFEAVNQLTRIQLNFPNFKTAVSEFLRDSNRFTNGFLGLLLSMVCGRICYPFRRDDERMEIAKLEIDVLSVTTSIKTEADLDNIELSDLDSNINYLKEQISKAPKITRDMFVSQLTRYERLRALKTSAPAMMQSLEQHMTTDVLARLRAPLIERGLIPQSFKSLEKGIFHVVMKNELDGKVDEMARDGEITPLDQSFYREANGKPFVTSLLLDSIHFRFGIKLSLSGYETPGEDLIVLD
jgi:hypothetical protein